MDLFKQQKVEDFYDIGEELGRWVSKKEYKNTFHWAIIAPNNLCLSIKVTLNQKNEVDV